MSWVTTSSRMKTAWFEPHRAILRKAAVDELWYWEADHAGRLWSHYCRYLRVERPRLLEFAWMSEATRGLESRVTLEMIPSLGATDLVLTHTGLPDDEMGRSHEEGWKGAALFAEMTGTLTRRSRGHSLLSLEAKTWLQKSPRKPSVRKRNLPPGRRPRPQDPAPHPGRWR